MSSVEEFDPSLSELIDRPVDDLAAFSSPLLSLPVELLDMILHYRIMNLVHDLVRLPMTSKHIFKSFCSLFLVCKTLNECLNRARPNIGVRYTLPNLLHLFKQMYFDYNNVYVPVGFCEGADNPTCPPTWRPRTWKELFQRHQASRFRDASRDPAVTYYGLPNVGKYWFNPYLEMRDFECLGRVFGDSSLIYLILPPTFERAACPLQGFADAELFQQYVRTMKKDIFEFSVGESSMVGHSFRESTYGFSVTEWKLGGRYGVTQASIAPEVTTWWIFGYQIIAPCIVGYHEGKSWVFETFAGHLYTNFKPDPIAGFGMSIEGHTRQLYQRHWVSMWSGQPTFVHA